MSKQRKVDQMLENLADALAEEVLSTSDEDILKEAEVDYGNTKQEIDKIRAIYQSARKMVAQERLTSAKEEVLKQKTTEGTVIRIDRFEARRKLDAILKQHPEAASEFTLAARKGKDLSDEDVLGMLEDLQELGIYHPEEDRDANQ